jgi:catechol 2,3-dioxygenase-like lactoylglutathione lyase family enzyme
MNLNQVTLPVLNVEQAIEFYTKLGLELIVQSIPEYARFACPDNGSTLSVHRVDNLTQGDGIWVYFELDNLDEYVAKIQLQGIQFEEMPTDKPWLWREARLKDLDGNQLIFYMAGENRINPPWRVGKTK